MKPRIQICSRRIWIQKSHEKSFEEELSECEKIKNLVISKDENGDQESLVCTVENADDSKHASRFVYFFGTALRISGFKCVLICGNTFVNVRELLLLSLFEMIIKKLPRGLDFASSIPRR